MTREFFKKVLKAKHYVTRRYVYTVLRENNLIKIVRYTFDEAKRMKKGDYKWNRENIHYDVVAIF